MTLSREEMQQGTEEFYAAMNAQDLDAIGGLLTDEVVDHQLPPGTPGGKEGVLGFFQMLRRQPPHRMHACSRHRFRQHRAVDQPFRLRVASDHSGRQ